MFPPLRETVDHFLPCEVPMSSYSVTATRTVYNYKSQGDGYRTVYQVPTFTLPACLGLPSVAEAEKVARGILSVPADLLGAGMRVEVSLSVCRIDD